MSYLQLHNNGYCYLSAELDNTSTTFITKNDFNLPTDTSSGNFYLTLFDDTSNEILLVTNIADTTGTAKQLTITRAQQDTTAKVWPIDTTGWINLTKTNITEIQDTITNLTTDDVLDTTSTNKYVTSSDLTKLSNIDITSSLDLNSMYDDIQVNNAKVSNSSHTGEVTGSTTLTIDPTAISGKSEVSPTSGDFILLWDSSDSQLKKSNISEIKLTDSTGTGTVLVSDGSGNWIEDFTDISISNKLNVSKSAKIDTLLDLTGININWNISNNSVAKIDLIADITGFTISGIEQNSNALLYLNIDATSYSVSWPASVSWINGNSPTLYPNTNNLISFVSYDGTGLLASFASDYSSYVGNVYSDSSSFTQNGLCYLDSSSEHKINYSTKTIDNILTTDSTNTVTNKINIPKKTTLTSGASISWNSDNGTLFDLILSHNAVLAADSGTPEDGQLAEFRIDNTGSYTFSLDNTSANNEFHFGSDITGVSTLDSTTAKGYILAQFDSSVSQWDVISVIAGF